MANSKRKRASSLLFLLFWALNGTAIKVQPYKFMTVPGAEKEPCFSSLYSAPSMNCINWAKNVRAYPTYEPARNIYLTGSFGHALYVGDAHTGRQILKVETTGRVVTKVLFSKDKLTIYFGTDKGVIYALDAFTFEEKFKYEAESSINNDFMIHEDKIFFTTSMSHVYCLNNKTGKLLWQLKRPLDKERVTLKNHSNFIIREETGGGVTPKVLIAPHPDGYLSFIKMKNGKQNKRLRLSHTETNFPDIVANMVVIKNELYVASHDHGLYSIDLSSGQIKNKAAKKGIVKLLGIDEKIYAMSTDSLYVYDRMLFNIKECDFKGLKTKPLRHGYPFNNNFFGGKRILLGSPSNLKVIEDQVVVAFSQGAVAFFDKNNLEIVKILGHSMGFGPHLERVNKDLMVMTRNGNLVRF